MLCVTDFGRHIETLLCATARAIPSRNERRGYIHVGLNPYNSVATHTHTLSKRELIHEIDTNNRKKLFWATKNICGITSDGRIKNRGTYKL